MRKGRRSFYIIAVFLLMATVAFVAVFMSSLVSKLSSFLDEEGNNLPPIERFNLAGFQELGIAENNLTPPAPEMPQAPEESEETSEQEQSEQNNI